MFQGGFLSGQTGAQLYKQGVLTILAQLKDDAVSLVDTIAPTDFIINSPLGHSDGEIYKHLQSSLIQWPEVFERPEWWKDVVYWRKYVQKSKL